MNIEKKKVNDESRIYYLEDSLISEKILMS